VLVVCDKYFKNPENHLILLIVSGQFSGWRVRGLRQMSNSGCRPVGSNGNKSAPYQLAESHNDFSPGHRPGL